ncbi:MAG: [protein-PII] uridylyltransferase [Gammaproteobacteria bacterium]|nr:MAG: [protein-PII] uridylyltransferase [Gammaproteobacteria bacterium]
MLNIDIYEVLEADAPILQFLQQDHALPLSVEKYKNFRIELLKLLDQRFRAQANIYELISLNTCVIDALLKNIWNSYEIPNDSAALLAIGGYGRREMFPESDIDIMIVLKDENNEIVKPKIESFLTFLWDISLHIAQSVRTINSCIEESKKDVTVLTSLMEHYYLAGSEDLYNQVRDVVENNKIWPSKKYFKEKRQELEDRHKKFGDTANHLEPNIKENPGGLRDIHTLRWLTNRHFKTESFEELAELEFLSNSELSLLQEAYLVLAKIRFALHLFVQRGDDRLLFDYQYEVASLLSYKNENRNQRVEEFMQVFYRTSNQLSTLSDIIIERLHSTIFPSLFKRRAKPINENFQVRAQLLEATTPEIFKKSPEALLECFQLLQEHKNLTGLSDQLQKLIIENLNVIDDSYRNNKTNSGTFISIISRIGTNYRELKRMAQLGVLGKYWPSFDAVTGRMQFDLFHIYTVEEHTLRVFENACQFSKNTSEGEYAAYHDIFIQTPKALTLYLAALFHDIAKGRGGDHSELGEVEAKSFCLQHGLTSFDANTVAWLVKNHLVMSITAQQQDIDDPYIIKEFANNVGNLTRLNYLYLLTIADMRGTNPKLWNSWRSALLSELYQRASQYLRQDVESPTNRDELVDQVKSSALQLLQNTNLNQDSCLAFWQELGDDYFIRHSDDEVMRHTQAILNHRDKSNVVVNIHQYSARGATEIFIYCNDRNYLFAHITSTLAKLRLSIVHARVITSNKGHALDTFLVLDANEKAIDDEKQCDLVKKELTQALEHPEEITPCINQGLPRQIRELRVPVEIYFDISTVNNYTTMEIKAPDFPGLLASLGNAFVDCSIAIHNARISTLGERVHNLFHISNLDYQALDKEHQEKLRKVILEYLQQPKQVALKV